MSRFALRICLVILAIVAAVAILASCPRQTGETGGDASQQEVQQGEVTGEDA